jgi:hypothetical protein
MREEPSGGLSGQTPIMGVKTMYFSITVRAAARIRLENKKRGSAIQSGFLTADDTFIRLSWSASRIEFISELWQYKYLNAKRGALSSPKVAKIDFSD